MIRDDGADDVEPDGADDDGGADADNVVAVADDDLEEEESKEEVGPLATAQGQQAEFNSSLRGPESYRLCHNFQLARS